MPKKNVCSFCGRSMRDMFSAPETGAFICYECVEAGHKMVQEYTATQAQPTAIEDMKLENLPKPTQIKAFLDQYVIGQDEAKKYLSVAVYNHYKRLRYKQTHNSKDDVDVEKSNLLLVGPTGSGKTLLAQTLARTLKVPFAIADATTLTEAGYVGEDVENVVRYLWQNANGDVELAKRGIIYIDEIDKIASKTDNVSITRDVGGEGVQQTLLKLVEGTVCRIPPKGGRKHPDQEFVHINTENILFICGGAFEGIERKIAQRLNTQVIGFDSEGRQAVDKDNLLQYVEAQDLRSYGLIPEIIGRLPVVTYLDKLDRNALKRILTKPKNAILKQYGKMFELDGKTLEIEPRVLDLIVDTAIERGLGARGLRSICEKIMTDAMYAAPSSKQKIFKIDVEYARERL